MASGPITSWEIDGETVETVSDFIFWAPKSLQMATAAMKLKDPYSLQSKGLSRVFSSTSLKASILWHSAFFMVQRSHPYMTTGKTIALIRWTSVNKVLFLLYYTLPRFITAFLPRSKHLLVSWLQSPSAVILEPKRIISVTVSIVSPSICHEVIGPGAMILVF